MADQPKPPNDSQRAVVIGRTGSGKTQFAAFLLSLKDFRKRKWFILDFKLDELLNSIANIKEHKLGDKIPKKPGLYITHPTSNQDKAVEAFLWQLWKEGNAGLFVDETYMIDKNSPAFRAILTQGRSKKLPVIMCTQRPVEVTRFCFSESEIKILFDLDDDRDIKTVRGFMPLRDAKGNIIKQLPQLPMYHSYWYDSQTKRTHIMGPGPDRDTILNNFRETMVTRPLVL